MEILTVHRNWKSAYNKTTILKNKLGKVKAIFNSSINQPRKGTKTIEINCNKFLLDWSNI